MNEEASALIRASSGKTRAGRLLLGAGALALLIPAVAGCEAGNGAPTLEFHAASAGAQTVFNGISITNAFVLGAKTGAAVPAGSSASLFVSLYNGSDSSDTLQSVTSSGAGSISLSGGSVALPANAAPVNLTGPEPQVVLENLTAPLVGGSTIPVTFTFAHAGSVKLQVPVEAQAFYWSTYSPPAPTPTAAAAHSTSTATPITSTGATPSASPSATGSATPSATASATPSATGSATP
jgi:copper(I)-binding protein